MAIHATADSATTQILARSIAGQRAGVGQVCLTSLDQTHVTDKGTNHDFLDGVGSIILR